MEQMQIPCVVYRGGTSRGLFFHESDLPTNEEIRAHIFLKAIGAEDASHINGLGAGTSHTSKVVIINKSDQPNIDINYNFIQLGIGNKIIDYEGTCGNLMAATGAFAVNEGLVEVDDDAESVIINVFSVNINKNITVQVPLYQGKAKVKGDYGIPGVSDSGAKFIVKIKNPGGGKTGITLPLGPKYFDSDIKYEYSFCDLVNPFVYLRANDLDLNGTELNHELMQNDGLLAELEKIRVATSIKSGLSSDIEEAKYKYVALPKVAYVSEPKDYKTSDGTLIIKESYDILARMVSMKKIHRTFAMSGLLNIAGACLLEGTIPNEKSRLENTNEKEKVVRIGHPEGVVSIKVMNNLNQKTIEYVGLESTARVIIKGDIFIPTKN